MSKRIFLSVTIVVCFLAVVQLFAFPNALRLQVIDRYEDSGISYDSFSPLLGTHEVIVPMRASAPFMHLNPSTGLAEDLTTRSFHISMSLVARSLDGFPNAFQTAPGNAGVRLEFTPGMAALVVATNQGDWRIIPVSTSFGGKRASHDRFNHRCARSSRDRTGWQSRRRPSLSRSLLPNFRCRDRIRLLKSAAIRPGKFTMRR